MYNKLMKTKTFISLFVLSFLFLPFLVNGASTIKLDPPTTHENLGDLIEALIQFLFWIALAVAPLLILVGAFYFMTAAGNTTKIETGKKIILYTCIGLFVILFARGIIAVIRMVLGVP